MFSLKKSSQDAEKVKNQSLLLQSAPKALYSSIVSVK